MDYMTLKEASEKWGVTPRRINLTAYDLLASGNKVQIWIAKDVIKELETVVKVKERKRLITSNSKMGRER